MECLYHLQYWTVWSLVLAQQYMCYIWTVFWCTLLCSVNFEQASPMVGVTNVHIYTFVHIKLVNNVFTDLLSQLIHLKFCSAASFYCGTTVKLGRQFQRTRPWILRHNAIYNAASLVSLAHLRPVTKLELCDLDPGLHFWTSAATLCGQASQYGWELRPELYRSNVVWFSLLVYNDYQRQVLRMRLPPFPMDSRRGKETWPFGHSVHST